MPSKTKPQIQNKLLAALPGKEYRRLLPHLEPVPLEFGRVLYEAGERMGHAYFPEGGLLSLLTVMEGGLRVRESGLIGNEGMLGVPLILGVDTLPTRALVQLPGTALKIKAKTLRNEFDEGGALYSLLHRFTYALFVQISQGGACAGTHPVAKRLCCWILMTHDRATGDEFVFTHEHMAIMLGVTRSVVTRTAGLLQRGGLIRYSRGKVTVLDREGLERVACPCYRRVKTEYEQVLP